MTKLSLITLLLMICVTFMITLSSSSNHYASAAESEGEEGEEEGEDGWDSDNDKEGGKDGHGGKNKTDDQGSMKKFLGRRKRSPVNVGLNLPGIELPAKLNV